MAKPKHIQDRFNAITEFGCVVCYLYHDVPNSPCAIHHLPNGAMGKRAGDELTIGLCVSHHQHGGHGVAVHAGRKAFEDRYCSELELLEYTNNHVIP